jgi:hypothetical protein
VERRDDFLGGAKATWVKLRRGSSIIAAWTLRAGGKLYLVIAQAGEETYSLEYKELEAILSTFRLAAPK